MKNFVVGRRRRAALSVVSLLALLAGCNPAKDGDGFDDLTELTQARWVEPRLTGASKWSPCRRFSPANTVVEKSDCGTYLPPPEVSQAPGACERMTTTHAETIRTLITQPACTDVAVERLIALSGESRDARIMSDLAAAYYVRAQRDDRPSDLLRSLDAAERAAASDDKLPAARFNLALAEDALGLREHAQKSWLLAAVLDTSEWSKEAAARADALERAATRNAALQWPLNRLRLPAVVRSGNSAAVRTLVAPYPGAAQRYVEEQVLPAWGSAGDPAVARERLTEASMIARELAAVTGDPYLREAVAKAATAAGAEHTSLREGHKAFSEARAYERAVKSSQAARAYLEASRAFERAGSAMRLGADLGYAMEISRLSADKAESERRLIVLEHEARRKGYFNVWARIQSNRALFLQVRGRYLEAFDLFDEAADAFRRMQDGEGRANVHIRKAALLRVLGHDEAALAESFVARRYEDKLVDISGRHVVAGETAATFLGLGFPERALAYQSDLVAILEDKLADELAKEKRDDAAIQGLRINRAIALRARAGIRLSLGDHETARRELDEALAVIPTREGDRAISDALRARSAEVEGLAAMQAGDVAAAIRSFTEALALSGPGRFRTYQAILLTERAEAHRLGGDAATAEADLRAAIAELNAEEGELLRGRARGKGEGIWSEYFSRFQESYHVLIRQLLEKGRKEEAFGYAEKARAFEPLKLVLELPVADEMLRALDTTTVDPKGIGTIRAALPEGTFVLEFQAGKTETFVWVFSRHDFDVVALPVGSAQIEEWTRSLQRAAIRRNVAAFNEMLSAPYAELLQRPLAAMSAMKGGTLPGRRLVIIPDRHTHGLPFAALRSPRGRRHLIETFPVAVAPSATLYVHALKRDAALAAAGGKPTALLIGDPDFDATKELSHRMKRLGAARREAEAAGTLYQPDAVVLVDKEATVPAFLRLAKDRSIVHVAGHAVVNRHPPFGTLLLMAPSESHTGFLYADELIRKLELDRARIVVLAACSSAGGYPVGPEGLAPLVRPIVAAGVPAVIGSLWTIDDAWAQKVLLEFHRNFREGYDAARALQLAQIHYLRNGSDAMPILAWAPFQIIGHAASPFPRVTDNERRGLP